MCFWGVRLLDAKRSQGVIEGGFRVWITSKIHEEVWTHVGIRMIDGRKTEMMKLEESQRSFSVWFTRLRGNDKSPITLYEVLKFNRAATTAILAASTPFLSRHNKRAFALNQNATNRRIKSGIKKSLVNNSFKIIFLFAWYANSSEAKFHEIRIWIYLDLKLISINFSLRFIH